VWLPRSPVSQFLVNLAFHTETESSRSPFTIPLGFFTSPVLPMSFKNWLCCPQIIIFFLLLLLSPKFLSLGREEQMRAVKRKVAAIL